MGTLDVNARAFRKQVKGSKHLMTVLDGLGVDKTHSDAYLLPRNYLIEVFDQESAITYKTDAAIFHKLGTVNDLDTSSKSFCPVGTGGL